MKLIKSNSHGNNVRVIVDDLGRYQKIANNEKGNEIIKREKQGYDWFGIDTKLDNTRLLWLTIRPFKGNTFSEKTGITGNEEWIKKLIEFYKVRWGTGKFAVHGDLALCNIIFGDKIYIIDWEHFHYNKREFFGFDIVNMLFIHLQYEYRWLSYWGWNWIPFIKPRHQQFIAECVKMLGNVEFTKAPFRNACWYINKYMNKNKFILGKQSPEILESLDWICQQSFAS